MGDINTLPNHCRRVSFHFRWHDSPRKYPNATVTYGRWDDDSSGDFFVPGLLTYSDYSGSTVERSNLRVFCEEFAKGEGRWWFHVVGAHGTSGVVVRTLAYRNAREVREFFDALEDYPLASDEDHSELEYEIQSECWESSGLSDFRRYLGQEYPEDDSRFDVIPDDVLSSVWYEVLSQGNGGEVECEDAVSAYFRFDYAERTADRLGGWRAIIVEKLHEHRMALLHCQEHDDCKASKALAKACKRDSLTREQEGVEA